METEKFHKRPEDPSVSACMIVKNEEKLLPQCLDSIKDVVDEIIIVDTGSTDRTVEIAKSYGAKVYHHLWQGSFSEARNYSLKYATCDWILQIDADEKLEEGDIQLLRIALRHKEYNSIFVALLSQMPGGISKNYFQRIYKKGKAHYEGIVHNQLVCEGKSLVTEIRFHHYGYNLDPEQMKKKQKRTEDLLKKQIAENPDFIFAWANLVRIYRCQEIWDEAIKTAEEAIKLDAKQKNPSAYQIIMCDMVYSYMRKNDYDKALDVCKELLEFNPDNLDGNFYIGGIYICKKDYQNAIQYYTKYTSLSEQGGQGRPDFTTLIVDTYGSQMQAWNNIGTSYVELGQLDRAAEAFRKAISYNNKDPLYYENLARTFLKQKKYDELSKVLEEAVNMGVATAPMYYQLSDIYRSQGKVNQAIEYLMKSLDIDKSSVKYRVCLGELIMSQGRIEEAENLYKEAAALAPSDPEILHGLAKANMKLLRENEALVYIDKIMQVESLNTDQYLHIANDWAIMEKYDKAIPFYEKYLESDPNNSSVLTNLATCYAKLGKYESAIIGYRAALAINPNDPNTMRNILALQKDISNAISSLARNGIC